MRQIQEVIIGIEEARELLPSGRGVYESVRKHLTDEPDQLKAGIRSRAGQVLGQLTSLHDTMIPPLPKAVVGTISDFVGHYDRYLENDDFDYITNERRRMENVADQLVSVVFEYGYSSNAQPPQRHMGTECN